MAALQSRDDVVATPFKAVVHTVVEVETTGADFSAILWMPESSMLSCSFGASQPVAVFVCQKSVSHTEDYYVENLEKRCSREYGFTNSCLVDGAGSYCAIASVWPCGKLTDGVKLSKQLAFTLGCLQPGIKISINALKCSALGNNREVNNTTVMDANVHHCSKLMLRWCPIDGKEKTVGTLQDSVSVRATCETRQIVPKSNKKIPTCKVEAKCSEENKSPKHGLGIGKFISPQKKVLSQRMWQSKDEDVLTEILADKNNRATKLVQKYAVWQFHDRYLMKGNVAVILLCGRYCIFNVVDAKLSANDHADEYGKDENISGLPWIQTPNVFHIRSNTLVEFIFHFTSSAKLLNLGQNPPYPKEISPLSEQIMVPSKNAEFSSLGGLSEQITILKEIIKFSLFQPERITSLGLHPPHGVLLYGPPGTGKTSLALASAAEAGVNIFTINGPEIINEYYGESEAALQSVFTRAQEEAPAMVFIDELDAIAPQRTNGSEDLARRLVATLLTIMDGSEKHMHRVLVVAATNRPDAIDSALRRPGRLDREIEIGVPSPAGRLDIFLSHLSRMRHTLTDENIRSLAAITHGFVGADISSLCNEAAMIALRRYVQGDYKSEGWSGARQCRNENQFSTEFSNVASGLRTLSISIASGWSDDSLRIRMTDFEEAKTNVRPSGMREVMLEVPKVHWSDIGGHEEIKQQLQEAVVWPQKHSDAFSRIGTLPPRGVLLYGPPGCSKTLMARAIATEAGLNFIAVKGPELFSKWVGESEKAVHSLFQRARIAAPSVVFFDELDGLAILRGSHGASVGDRVISQLLVEMDGLNPRNGVTVIAATNRPDKIDSALLRPGRFDKLLYVGRPDEAARFQIFTIHMRNMPIASDVDKKVLAMCTKGYTGADIAGVCREAAMAALEEDLNAKEVMMRHFDLALKSVQNSVTEVSELTYLKFNRGLTSSTLV